MDEYRALDYSVAQYWLSSFLMLLKKQCTMSTVALNAYNVTLTPSFTGAIQFCRSEAAGTDRANELMVRTFWLILKEKLMSLVCHCNLYRQISATTVEPAIRRQPLRRCEAE